MSWGEYLQGGSGLMNHYQKIESCGIFGHNGSTWAQVGMDHTQEYYNEITDLVGLFTDPSSGKGFMLRNSYVTLRIDNTVLSDATQKRFFVTLLRVATIQEQDDS